MNFAFSAMAARSDMAPARWRKPLLSWLDGIEAGWAVPLLLVVFLTVWMAFLVIAYLGGDLHADVLETWTLGRTFEWGAGSKHPPLMAWVARAWTSVFPLANWSFQLMALTNSAIALWAVDLISRHFVKGDKRLVVLLLLMLLPTYQLHAQRFNANTVLLATWPLATYCFLRSFETRRIVWAVAAGATAALAMLGKYYSVFLVSSFVLAAICHPQRRLYFGSTAPWISTIVGVAALGAHVHWLVTTGAMPFTYAIATHAGKSFGHSLTEVRLFILGIALVLALPTVTWVLIAGNRLKKLRQDFLTMNSGLLLLSFISVGTIILPVITSIGLGADLPPIWALQGLFLFIIVIVCSTSYPIERFHSVNLAVFVFGVAVLAVVVAAPAHALYRNVHPLAEGRNFYRLSAIELTRIWHEHSDTALPTIGGDDGLAFAMAFYSPDHPKYEERLVFPVTEIKPLEAPFKRGWAALCFNEQVACIASMEKTASRASRFFRSRFVVQSALLGQHGTTQGFTAIVVPPSVEGTTTASPPVGASEDSNTEPDRKLKP